MRFIQYISIALCTFLIGFFIYQTTPRYQIIEGKVFGTFYKIKIKSDIKNKELKEKVKQKLDDIDKQMSVFRQESEVSKINQLPKGKTVVLSDEMSLVLKAAKKVWNQSNGIFDPTLGRVIDLWGFGPNKTKDIPSEKELQKAMSGAGFQKIKLKDNFHQLEKTANNTILNLSAIAKGYAVDELALLLDAQGYDHYVVEIGGEVKTKGFRSANQEPWTIGVSKPTKDSTENMLILSLSNIAVATSGNYRNFHEYNSKTYAHTISAKTGKPVLTNILSVSVFHDSCMYADAYATAMMGMNVQEALAFADKYKLKVLIYDNSYQAHTSQAAKEMF